VRRCTAAAAAAAASPTCFRVSTTIPNGTSYLHLRVTLFNIAAVCHALRRDDTDGRGNCITYIGETLPFPLSVELYFHSEDNAMEFIRRLYLLVPDVAQPVLRLAPEPCEPPAGLVQLLEKDHDLSARTTPLSVTQTLRCRDSAGAPSDNFADDDLAYEALHPPDYYTSACDAPESCHIVPKRLSQELEPLHNRLIMTDRLHSWFDGSAQRTMLRHPTLFITLGEGGPRSFAAVPDRVFVPIRLFVDVVIMRAVEYELSQLVPHRVIDGQACLETSVVDDRTVQVYVGFQRCGRTDDQVRDAVGAALRTRPRPDRVRPAPPLPEELDQTDLTGTDDET
jgi:hypothetical protein